MARQAVRLAPGEVALDVDDDVADAVLREAVGAEPARGTLGEPLGGCVVAVAQDRIGVEAALQELRVDAIDGARVEHQYARDVALRDERVEGGRAGSLRGHLGLPPRG